MSGTFPSLATGSIAQYPFQREYSGATEICQFVNFQEQAYQEIPAIFRAWQIKVSMLSANETATLQTFFDANLGRDGVFSFTDPFDTMTFTSCSFGNDNFPHSNVAEGSNSVALVVYAHR